MDKYEVIIGIIIISILIVFLIIVLLASNISAPPRNNITLPSTETGEFLSSCLTTECNDNLVCNGVNYLCKLPENSPCTSFFDCVSDFICSGLCATGPTGLLNQLCPCESNYTCLEQTSGLRLCKGLGGATCLNNNDCASDICDLGVCAFGLPNSSICQRDQDCASNNCSNGFCQPQGVITGNLGSSCAGPCVTFEGSVCNNTSEQPLKCECIDGTGLPGTCILADNGILESCSTDVICSNNLICYNSNGNNCQDTDNNCLCTFPYENPNNSTNGLCINGMESGVNNLCFNQIGIGCDSGGQCISNICNGPSVMTSYIFSDDQNQNLGTNFLGALSTSIYNSFNGPNGLIKPYKIFSTSNNDIDTIYLVDHNQGFLYIQYNPFTQTIINDWVLLIPYNNNGRILIDVAFNDDTYLVAFNEGNFDTIYTWGGPQDPNNFVPFNVQVGPGIDGTQYTQDNIPLSIDYISNSMENTISSGNDVLISFNGTIYIKRNTETRYSIGTIVGGDNNGEPMVGFTGPAYFYFDNGQNLGSTGTPICPGIPESNNPIMCPSYDNISFINNNLLNFSGDVSLYTLPNDRFGDVEYRVFDYNIFSPQNGGMQNSSIILLTQAFQNNILIDNIVALSNRGSLAFFPYSFGKSSKSVASNNAFYILSISSCS